MNNRFFFDGVAKLSVTVAELHAAILVHGRADLLVEGKVIVEVKAVEKLIPIHDQQILTYMFFAKCPTGLLLNFHAFPFAEKGIKRFKL